jgi:osmotically-inducible protein OsmY
MRKPDAEIREDVLHELHWDTRLDTAEIDVTADSGAVTLLGTVSSWAERMAAQEAAYRVAGVLDVANDLDVKVSSRAAKSDAEVAQAVRLALEWNVFVRDQRVWSTVSNGQVTLDGVVENGTQREEAERAIRNLASVRSVINRVQVKAPTASSYEVQHAIESALERRADREARRIGLDVHEGRVVLTGIVHSWAERQSVVGAARGTPGVRSIDDRLRFSLD